MQKTATQDQEMNAPCAQGGNLVVARGTSPLAQSNTLRSDEQTAKPQSPTVKTKRENFTQVPHVVMDCSMKDIEKLGFLQFMRHFWKDGYFEGSLGKLCRILNMAKATISRAITSWIQSGWMSREDTDIGMRLTLHRDLLWSDNDKLCCSPQKQQSKSVPERNTSVPTGNSTVPERNTTVSVVNTAVPHRNTAVPTVSSNSTQYKGNIGNISLNTEEYKGNTGERPSNVPRIETPSLPVPPPSSSSLENKISDSDSLIKKGVLALSEKHLGPPSRKETAMEIQTALSEMVRRYESLSHLIGEDEALRQCEIALLYLKHVDKFWREHQQFLTLVKAEKNIDEAMSKAKDWTPPTDAPRLYPDPVMPVSSSLPAAIAQTQPFNVTQANGDALEGMTLDEAQAFDARLSARYPGIDVSYGDLTGGRYTVGVRVGAGDEDWMECYSAQDWYNATGFRRRRVERAMAYYRATHSGPATEEIDVPRLAMAMAV